MVLCESREMYSMAARARVLRERAHLGKNEKKHRGVIDVKVPDIDKLPCE